MKTIGIPRGLFFYYYYPLWKTFFSCLGLRVVASPPTNRRIVDEGVLAAVDEACLPVKVYYGHVIELCRLGVDYIFTPRLVSVEHRSYICPKFMGIPDMLRAQISDLPTLIDIKIDLSQNDRQLKRDMRKIGAMFDRPARVVDEVYRTALEELRRFRRIARSGYTLAEAINLWEAGEAAPDRVNGKLETTKEGNRSSTPSVTVGLLGHGYSVYDRTISMNLVERLKGMGARVVTPEMLDSQEVEAYASTLPKRMFWTLGKKMIGSALKMEEDEDINGIIYLACFGCGPDSLVGEIIERRVTDTPFMLVTVDEHTGEAGIITRLEAFCDMIIRRKQMHETHLPAYG